MNTPEETLTVEKKASSGVANIVIQAKEGEVNAQSLSPVELVNVRDLSLNALVLH